MSKGKISQTDELRIRFTAWITVVVQRAKIDYIRKQNKQPKSVPLDEISEDEFCTEHNFNNQFADIRDKTYDSVSEYLEAYEQDVYLEKIAKRVTDINYPLNGYDEKALFLNFRAEEIYIKLLKENGDAYVHMEAPQIDELLKNKSQEITKKAT